MIFHFEIIKEREEQITSPEVLNKKKLFFVNHLVSTYVNHSCILIIATYSFKVLKSIDTYLNFEYFLRILFVVNFWVLFTFQNVICNIGRNLIFSDSSQMPNFIKIESEGISNKTETMDETLKSIFYIISCIISINRFHEWCIIHIWKLYWIKSYCQILHECNQLQV